ncbi:MAG: PDZ domain-containing protein [Armatimonadetes bacterium]|nr:PDZ domain-containing protein [Armatimonadota bacterium]
MISLLVATSLLTQGAAQVKPIIVPFHMAETAMIVDATVNGVQGSFMFDTGFGGTFILGEEMNVGKATGTMTLRDFVGEFQAKTVKVKTLSIGDVKIDPKDKVIVQQPSRDMTDSYGTHVDGIMGLEVFLGKVFEINFQKSQMIFYPDSYDISTKVPDGKKTFLSKMLPLGQNAIEMQVKTKAGKKFILALDTGNGFYATTYKETLEEAGLMVAGKKPDFMGQSFVASGAVDSFNQYLEEMTIFGVPVQSSVWNIIDLPSSAADSQGTVGFEFLSNFNVTIDMNRRRVWFELFKESAGNEAPGDLGLIAQYEPTSKRVLIYNVIPKSPADKAGIKRGDQLLSVGDSDMLRQTYRQLRNMFQGKKGTKVKIVTSRNGSLMRTEMEREYLINGWKETAAPKSPASAGSSGQ